MIKQAKAALAKLANLSKKSLLPIEFKKVIGRTYLSIRLSDELWFSTTKLGRAYHLLRLGWFSYNEGTAPVFSINLLWLSIHVAVVRSA
ncbi:hypothetical protein [Methylomonas fluvii]|uniref:Uncharacterized protein n=1 Tax=Methylomonas fluvii TaxID=1854564 RepID=A0ABR9DM00_9GAMM|nr:hypothetical protein [Methylomonas fluvii]MBD9362947.1 hypothetical protein [Methylomonas fluvii]